MSKIIHNGTVVGSTSVTGDTLPVGAEFEFDGTTIPEGYEEVIEDGNNRKAIIWTQ